MFATLRSPLICSFAVAALGLSGCGQKGPLFMPVKQPVAAAMPAVARPPAQPSMPSAPTTDGPAATATPSPR